MDGPERVLIAFGLGVLAVVGLMIRGSLEHLIP